MTETTIVWFRRDLRLADQPALAAARARGGRIVFAYVHAPEEERPWAPGAASNWWLDRSLTALSADLAARGATLVIRRGPSATALVALARETGATHVEFGALYEPAARARDVVVVRALEKAGVAATSHHANVLFDPESVRNGSGAPYKVFTPYWRLARTRLHVRETPGAPKRLDAHCEAASESIGSLGLAPRIAWDAGLASSWTPGEAGAHEMLAVFLDDAVRHYEEGRDRPDRHGTSRLSPYLHFGELSPMQILAAMKAHRLLERGEPYVRQLGWREFSVHLLVAFSTFPDVALNPKYADFPWAPDDEETLARWQRGMTGIPIVDAGMRELWRTGWMHNRVRMLVASFLTKNLRLHWRHGARWFWDTLVDADLANNSQGWQWVAGTGTDAAPYFRVFNPVTQGERFDPAGDYVRRHVPELAGLDAKFIHRPWQADAATRRAAGADAYPAPMVDLADSRNAALDAWRRLR